MSVRVGARGPRGSSAPRDNLWCVGRRPDGSPCCAGWNGGIPLPFNLPRDVKNTDATGSHKYIRRYSHPRHDCCVVRALVAGGWANNFRCKWWRDTPEAAESVRNCIDADSRVENILHIVGKTSRPPPPQQPVDYSYYHMHMQAHQHMQQMQALQALQTYNALNALQGGHASAYYGSCNWA